MGGVALDVDAYGKLLLVTHLDENSVDGRRVEYLKMFERISLRL
jgi:hypothetical protein